MGTGKKILLWIGGIIAVLVLIVMLLPTRWSVETQETINAPVAMIHAQVNNLREWRNWSTPFPVDESMKYTYDGPEEGAGASMNWQGNSGFGMMRITKSETDKGVWFESALGVPKPNSTGAITYVVDGDKVRVTWAGEGDLFPIIGGIFKSAWETGVVDYYDYALTKLKQRVEKQLAGRPTGIKAAAPADAGVADAAAPTEGK